MTDGLITLEDVAERAGVSISTASRALAGLKVRKANLEKVQAAADALGYVANEGARSLRSVRTMAMGLVFNQLSDALGLETLEGLTSGLEEHGYSLFVSTARGQEERYDLLVRRFLERRVDALFCVNAIGEGQALERFERAGIPVLALFGQSGGYERLPLFASSIRNAADAAIERLQALGHRRIAVIRPRMRSRPVEAFHRAARDAGLSIRSYEPSEGVMDGVTCLHALLEDSDPPTAIVGRHNEVGQVFHAADDMHLIVPRDLSIVAIRDRSPETRPTRLPMSSIHLNPGKVARAAAEFIVRVLSQGEAIPRETYVEMATWVDRATIGPAMTEKVRAAS